MYCSPQWHDDSSKHHLLDDLKKYWIDIYSKTSGRGLKYKIAFTGGEVTNSKHLMPFIEWIHAEYKNQIHQILITTNGSATFDYYSKLFEYVDNITFSVHSEHIDEQVFFETVTRLKKTIDASKFIHVSIMDEFWNTDRIEKYKDLLLSAGISYNVNTVNYAHQTRSYPIFKGKLNLEL